MQKSGSRGSVAAFGLQRQFALLEETECLLASTAVDILKAKVKKAEMLEANQKAPAAGRDFIDHYVRVGAVSQPDGFAY